MADYRSIAAYLGLQPLIHSQGHNLMGSQLEIPTHVDYKNAVENWNEPRDWRKGTAMHGSGFGMQDIFAGAVNDPDWRKATGIYKLFYPLGLKLLKANTREPEGDIGGIKNRSGNRQAGQMLMADALSDIFFDNSKRNISFDIKDGIPSLMFNRRF